jgi:hypothetical protein
MLLYAAVVCFTINLWITEIETLDAILSLVGETGVLVPFIVILRRAKFPKIKLSEPYIIEGVYSEEDIELADGIVTHRRIGSRVIIVPFHWIQLGLLKKGESYRCEIVSLYDQKNNRLCDALLNVNDIYSLEKEDKNKIRFFTTQHSFLQTEMILICITFIVYLIINPYFNNNKIGMWPLIKHHIDYTEVTDPKENKLTSGEYVEIKINKTIPISPIGKSFYIHENSDELIKEIHILKEKAGRVAGELELYARPLKIKEFWNFNVIKMNPYLIKSYDEIYKYNNLYKKLYKIIFTQPHNNRYKKYESLKPEIEKIESKVREIVKISFKKVYSFEVEKINIELLKIFQKYNRIELIKYKNHGLKEVYISKYYSLENMSYYKRFDNMLKKLEEIKHAVNLSDNTKNISGIVKKVLYNPKNNELLHLVVNCDKHFRKQVALTGNDLASMYSYLALILVLTIIYFILIARYLLSVQVKLIRWKKIKKLYQ